VDTVWRSHGRVSISVRTRIFSHHCKPSTIYTCMSQITHAALLVGRDRKTSGTKPFVPGHYVCRRCFRLRLNKHFCPGDRRSACIEPNSPLFDKYSCLCAKHFRPGDGRSACNETNSLLPDNVHVHARMQSPPNVAAIDTPSVCPSTQPSIVHRPRRASARIIVPLIIYHTF